MLAPLPPALSKTSDMEAWIAARQAGGEVYLVQGVDGARLGLFFVKPDASGPIYLGYLFAEGAWGQGYASELVGGAVAALGRSPGLGLRASVVPGNRASMRVLEKNGFRLMQEADQNGVLTLHRTV